MQKTFSFSLKIFESREAKKQKAQRLYQHVSVFTEASLRRKLLQLMEEIDRCNEHEKARTSP